MPLLLQLLVWYVGVLRALPMPQNSWALGFGSTFDVRGLHLPRFVLGRRGWAAIAFVIGVVAAIALARWARKRREETGQPFPVLASCAGLVVGLPLLRFCAGGFPLTFDYPTLGRFNFEGGLHDRAGVHGAARGAFHSTPPPSSPRSCAAASRRCRAGRRKRPSRSACDRRDMLRLVVVPQAMRIIIPPLTNQYLNLTKNSSLAVAIGYPDLVSVFAGTVLNQTGQAVEVILITMGVYLALSLLTALAMNWFNARMALVER